MNSHFLNDWGMAQSMRERLASIVALALLCWVLTGQISAAAEPAPARMTATVVEFSVRGDLDEQAGAIIADLMMSAIANSGRFTLKDRLPLSAASKIAKAQELGSTGLLDPKTAAELGRLYEVDAVVTGGVSKLGDLITVTARLIDTKTASLLASGQVQDKDIDAIQIKINDLAGMVLTPPAPPQTYALTVRTDPTDAEVRLLNYPTPYQPGTRLPAGNYEIEVVKPGYLTRKETVRINDRDVALNVALDKARYGLTVRPDPVDAKIRLLGASAPYQPGVALPPGDYEVELSREGYLSRKLPIRIVDSEINVPVTLEKLSPPLPRQYRLTVQADPPQAKVRLLNASAAYQPGVSLLPGSYAVEISQSGYESAQVAVSIIDSDVTIPIKLTKKPEPPPPKTYRLTIQADPSDARVRLLRTKTVYKAGVALPPGNYTIEISRTGYESKSVTVQIAENDQTVPVVLVKQPEPEPPTLYRLTVQADPADARVRLLRTKTAYKAGVSLPPGSYTVEVSRGGYETKQVTVRLADGDQTVPITLTKQPEPEPPTLYRLTVQADPADARVRLLRTKTAYKAGVSLPPGSYTVEVSRGGYETKQVTVRLADGDQTVPITLTKQPEPEPPAQYRLTVRADPSDARIRLRGVRTLYQPGVLLLPGSYTVEVSRGGYETKQVTVRLADGDQTVPVVLMKEAEPERPTQYRLTVRAEPSSATARLVNSSHTYRPGVFVPPGRYTIEVGARGYESKRVTIQIMDSDLTVPVELEKIASVAPSLPPATARPGEWRIGAVQIDNSLSGVDRSEISRVLNGYVGRTVTRDTLLDGALRVYQSTGITLGFVVRSAASSRAELYVRAVRQTRRTYESSVSIISRSQLEKSGFGVSVE